MAVSEHSICSVMLLTGLLSLGSTTHPLLLNGITARSSLHTLWCIVKVPALWREGGKKALMNKKAPEPLADSLCILGEISESAVDNLSPHRNCSIIHS